MAATIVWFRQDLRLGDNPALLAAIKRGGPVIPVYVWDESGEAPWPPGGASRWWLHHSLSRLDENLRTRSSRLILAAGPSGEVLGKLIKETGASAVYWNRRYEPAIIKRDQAIKAGLTAIGVEAKSFNASLLFEPHTVKNKAGAPFQVFTPFWKHCQTLPIDEPIKMPRGALTPPLGWPASRALADFGLLPKNGWDGGLATSWQPGETSAAGAVKRFAELAAEQYAARRDFPALAATSALSPHLHFGEIGPRQIWAAMRARSSDTGVFPANRGVQVYLNEIGWREFAYHQLFHFPQTPEQPLRKEFEAFPWQDNQRHLKAWQRGQTGYPIVDAGLRQLWQTGWMHNRVRMIAASFLVKHLRLSWREGAAWFWDTLVDADLASNTLGWQWSAGCGADAAPYFRIFNPMLQGAKFDPDGTYVRHWVPELAKIPDEFIHHPWDADPAVLASAGVALGRDYPHPLVNHGEARAAALAALATVSKSRP